MANLKIEVLSRKLIKPCNSTPDNLQRYKLSLFDKFAFPIYAPLLYCYQSEGDSGKAGNDERCHKLEKSLSQILTKFYPLAGRYMEEELCVHCEDQGVECIEAQVNGELAHLLQPSDFPEHIFSKFLPWDTQNLTHSSIRPLLAVQINTFDCGSIVLGIRISHILADLFTLGTFVNEWAKTCRGEMREELYPSFGHLPSLFPAGTSLLPKRPTPSANKVNLVSKIFSFDQTKIASIKESLFTPDHHFSKVVVVTAVMWKGLIEVALAKQGCLRDSIMGLTMNMRGKSKAAPAALDTACGNFLFRLKVRFEANKSNAQLHDLMVLLRSVVEKARARFENVSIDDILSMYLKRHEEMLQEFRGTDVNLYFCSSGCGFPLYEADFSWGKPHLVTPCPSFILLMDSNNGGIRAYLALTEEDMNIFQKSLDTSAFVSPSSILQYVEKSKGPVF